MAEKPDKKLDEFRTKFEEVGNAIMGSGNSQGVLLPKGVIVMVSFGVVLETMHINGIYQHLSQPAKLSSLIVLYTVAIQLVVSLINRLAGNDAGPVAAAHNLMSEFVRKEQRSAAGKSILMASIDRILFYIHKCYLPVNFVIFHTPIITSIVISIYEREYIMAFHAFLPFIDPNTLFGYLVNMTVQTLGSTMVFVNFALRDVNTIFNSLQTVAMVDVFAVKLEDLGEKFIKLQGSSGNPVNSRLKTASASILNDISHQKQLKQLESYIVMSIIEFNDMYNTYIDHLGAFNNPNAFVVLSMDSIGIGLSLLYMKLVSVPIGMSLAFMLFFQVSVPCVIGTVVLTQNEKLLQAVCDFPWYELSPRMKKIYLQIIHQCQNANCLELPIIGTLDMELFANVMNAGYSYLNYLLGFV